MRITCKIRTGHIVSCLQTKPMRQLVAEQRHAATKQTIHNAILTAGSFSAGRAYGVRNGPRCLLPPTALCCLKQKLQHQIPTEAQPASLHRLSHAEQDHASHHQHSAKPDPRHLTIMAQRKHLFQWLVPIKPGNTCNTWINLSRFQADKGGCTFSGPMIHTTVNA